MNLYRLSDGRLVPSREDPGPPAVADSWLVNEGSTRALDLHRARFGASCRIRGISADQLDLFWAGLLSRLPMSGRWFPRAELSVAGQLYLRLRPSPPLGTQVTVWPYPGPDPRSDPRTKGPDLALLAEVRAQAAVHGADEALLLSADGYVLEGTTSNLLWWDGDTLCLPSDDLPVLPGVTSRVIVRLAEDDGIPVRRCRARLADLDGQESWLVNALHGLRPVTDWADAPLRAAPPARAADWARRLGGGPLAFGG
jgi:branched-subunit amino acid aminotransferase/4-amino-4-deoxychorismate lyase